MYDPNPPRPAVKTPPVIHIRVQVYATEEYQLNKVESDQVGILLKTDRTLTKKEDVKFYQKDKNRVKREEEWGVQSQRRREGEIRLQSPKLSSSGQRLF